MCDAKEYLLEDRQVGGNVTVIGGGLTGCEVAYTLAKQGKNVSLIELMPDILQVADLCKVNSDMLRDLLRFHNVHVYTGAATKEIGGDYVKFEKDGETSVIAADNVIMAIGYDPQTDRGHGPRSQDIRYWRCRPHSQPAQFRLGRGGGCQRSLSLHVRRACLREKAEK